MEQLLQEINNQLNLIHLSSQNDNIALLFRIKEFLTKNLAKHEMGKLEDEALSNHLSSLYDFWEDIMPAEDFQKWKKLNKIEF